MTAATRSDAVSALEVEFCGEIFTVEPGDDFFVGRESDLVIDDNPYLHRRFLRLYVDFGMWWLANTGKLLSATVSDPTGMVQAWLAPGARLPIVFPELTVMFTAGPTTYDFSIKSAVDFFNSTIGAAGSVGVTTVDPVALTPSQRLLVVALCEHVLRRDQPGRGHLPTAAQVAARLGWPLTTYNRKLDNVCDKLDKLGVPGLRGERGKLATHRRARLVEYAIASRTVGLEDLALLETSEPAAPEDG